MQKVHIRNIFRLFVPLQLPQGYEIQPCQQKDNFGFLVVNKKTKHQYAYRLELIQLADDSAAKSVLNWGVWAKRNPIYYRTNAEENCVEGVSIRVKVKYGLFDFRKLSEVMILISINCFVDGVLMQQGATSVLELLPKKRQGPLDEETCIFMQWQDLNQNTLNYNNEVMAHISALEKDLDSVSGQVDESELSTSPLQSPSLVNNHSTEEFEMDQNPLEFFDVDPTIDTTTDQTVWYFDADEQRWISSVN